MMCERCRGMGKCIQRIDGMLGKWPCPECGGSGIRDCCDGEDAEGESDVTKDRAE